jgi:hypothetical protein
VLLRFYKEFVKNQEKDPSGFKALQFVLGTEDMEQFQKDWQAFVLKLKFG